MKIAPFERRLGAWLIDEIVPCLLGSGLMVWLFHLWGSSQSRFWPVLLGIAASYLYYILINSLFYYLSRGSSLGGYCLGLRMRKASGERPGFGACFLKALLVGLVPYDIGNAIYMLTVHTEISSFDLLTDCRMYAAKTLN